MDKQVVGDMPRPFFDLVHPHARKPMPASDVQLRTRPARHAGRRRQRHARSCLEAPDLSNTIDPRFRRRATAWAPRRHSPLRSPSRRTRSSMSSFVTPAIRAVADRGGHPRWLQVAPTIHGREDPSARRNVPAEAGLLRGVTASVFLGAADSTQIATTETVIVPAPGNRYHARLTITDSCNIPKPQTTLTVAPTITTRT
jgi:hypothetical protein